jgi:hypothetical protein
VVIWYVLVCCRKEKSGNHGVDTLGEPTKEMIRDFQISGVGFLQAGNARQNIAAFLKTTF